MEAIHSLCTATFSTTEIKEEVTDRSEKLTAWGRALSGKMTGTDLVKNSYVMEIDVS